MQGPFLIRVPWISPAPFGLFLCFFILLLFYSSPLRSLPLPLLPSLATSSYLGFVKITALHNMVYHWLVRCGVKIRRSTQFVSFLGSILYLYSFVPGVFELVCACTYVSVNMPFEGEWVSERVCHSVCGVCEWCVCVCGVCVCVCVWDVCVYLWRWVFHEHRHRWALQSVPPNFSWC